MCPWAVFCCWWQIWITAVEIFQAGPLWCHWAEIVINWTTVMPSTEEGTRLGVIPRTKSWEVLEDGLTLVMMVLWVEPFSGLLLLFIFLGGRWEITCVWFLLLMCPHTSLHLLRASALAPAPQRWLFSIPVFSIRNLELCWGGIGCSDWRAARQGWPCAAARASQPECCGCCSWQGTRGEKWTLLRSELP